MSKKEESGNKPELKAKIAEEEKDYRMAVFEMTGKLLGKIGEIPNFRPPSYPEQVFSCLNCNDIILYAGHSKPFAGQRMSDFLSIQGHVLGESMACKKCGHDFSVDSRMEANWEQRILNSPAKSHP